MENKEISELVPNDYSSEHEQNLTSQNIFQIKSSRFLWLNFVFFHILPLATIHKFNKESNKDNI